MLNRYTFATLLALIGVSAQGVLAPAAIPRAIIDRLYHEVSRALRTPEVKERLNAEGAEVVASPGKRA